MTLRLDYRTDYDGLGNSYGYSVHNAETRAALRAAGVRVCASAPVAFHVASPLSFHPVPGKTNVLYIAWETTRLPDDHAARIQGADMLLVTAPWLVPVFQEACPGKPVHVVPLGVRAREFPFRPRRIDRRKPFRYLWVGAPNARKGYELVLEAWRMFEYNTDTELYMKTTVTDRCETFGNITFDARNLTRAELVELYHDAHAFLFPTYGEGFGLTLFEAMATGCPALWTDWSAPADFFDPGGRFGYPLDYTMREIDRGAVAQADLDDLVRTMIRVRQHYATGTAQRKARRASRHIRVTLTWENTARRIVQCVRCLPGVME